MGNRMCAKGNRTCVESNTPGTRYQLNNGCAVSIGDLVIYGDAVHIIMDWSGIKTLWIIEVTSQLLTGHFPPSFTNIKKCSYDDIVFLQSCLIAKSWNDYHMELCTLYAKIQHIDVSYSKVMKFYNELSVRSRKCYGREYPTKNNHVTRRIIREMLWESISTNRS